jgi:CheY-like chemotaxis protein
MPNLPVYYVRPTILCIDDDKSITDSLSSLLGKYYSTVCFNEPDDLLNYLKNYQSLLNKNKLFREFVESEYHNDSTASLIQFDFKNINKIIDDINIADEIGLILIDNTMPKMNGLQLCERLSGYCFKKILYTASDDYKSGLDAVINKKIDSFISKSDPVNLLLDKIEQFTFEYFYDNTLLLKQNLEIENQLPLSDKLFVNYLKQLLQEKSIVKYCLIDKNGSLRMVDKNGKKFTLLVHTDRSIENILELIAEEKDRAEVYEALDKKRKIPHIDYDKINLDLSTLKLYTPSVLIGNKRYYIYLLEE